MVSVDEALQHILAAFQALPTERIAPHQAAGRVLGQAVISEIDLPPFAASSMDGFAVQAESVSEGSALPVVMDIPAGVLPDQALLRGQAARIMTGAAVPAGADAVIPFELTDVVRMEPILPGSIITKQTIKPGANVRPVGEDVKRGDVVLAAGRVLRAVDLGALASLGITHIAVIRRSRVALLSTGDELVEPDQTPGPGQIRDANRTMLRQLALGLGADVIDLGIARDTDAEVEARFERAIAEKADLILSSAGVSVGAFDVVKQVIERIGALSLWKVNLRPGKPLAFGNIAGIPYMGLPGNPVSAVVTFDVFARPAILKMGGRADDPGYAEAITAEPISSDGRRTYMRVRLEARNGVLVARSTGTQSSGALTSLVKADGLLIIPEDMTEVPVGTRLPVRLFETSSSS